jgi:hypothetical protein
MRASVPSVAQHRFRVQAGVSIAEVETLAPDEHRQRSDEPDDG